MNENFKKIGIKYKCIYKYVLCVTLVPKPEERLNRSAIQNSSPPLNQSFGRVDVSFPVKYLKSQII